MQQEDIFTDSEDDNDVQDENPPLSVGRYNPNVGLPRDVRLGTYSQELKNKVIRDGMWGLIPEEDVQLAIDRLKVLDPAWATLQFHRHNKRDARGTEPHKVMGWIRDQAMTLTEWNDLWVGLGQWMLPRRRRQGELRQRYELRYPIEPEEDEPHPKYTPGKTAKDNLDEARATLGRQRASAIMRPLPAVEMTWTFEGE